MLMFIQSLHLLATDIPGTKKFYNELLGVSIIEESDKHLSFAFGSSALHFHVTTVDDPYYHLAFLIPNNKLQEAFDWVQARTNILPSSAEEVIADFTTWNAKSFYFYDNQQNILEFITHYDLQITAETPFAASSVTGVCEIGIPVVDVAHACKEFNTLFKIPYFIKGPRSQDFAVMGDANGLFIISQIGRCWWPTQRKAEKHWIKVLIENDGVKNEFVFE
jgi:hypothetical protein